MAVPGVFLKNEADTLALGQQLAQAVKMPGVVFLNGDLGAGKTTLVRGFLRALGYDGTVKSPTYTLVEPYELPTGMLYHFDLYRLHDPKELEYCGARDYFNEQAICLVEWSEKGAGFLPEPDWLVTLDFHTEGQIVGRWVTMTNLNAEALSR